MNDRVTGAIRYSQDVERPGMLHARIVRSPHAHARVLSVDASMVADDVVVLLPEDVADLHRYGSIVRDETVLAAGRVRYIGDPVAAVAAATPEAASAALLDVIVDYEELPGVFDPVAGAEQGAPLVHDPADLPDNEAAYVNLRPDPGTNVCHRFRLRHGRGDEGFAGCDVVVEGEWRCAGAQHAPMEPHATVAEWTDGRLHVWTGTQTPFNVRQELASTFGIEPEAVRIVVPPMGGSFGAKTFSRLEPIVAALARKAGRPVKAVLPRDEVFLTLNRHPAVIRVRLGATRDGAIVAKRVWGWWDTGAYADCGPNVAMKGGYAAVGPYRIPHVAVDSLCVYTNRPPNGAFRGYAATQAAWASEQAMDLLADRLGVDPLELRLRNVLVDGDAFATGEVVHDFRVRECLIEAAERVGWRDGRRGKGLCALMKGMQTPSRAEAAIEIRDGVLQVRSATTEIGQGAYVALPRLAAEALGVDPAQVVLGANDTDEVPFDTRTTSSRSTHMMGLALGKAAAALREAIAERMEAAAADLRFVDGGVGVVGSPAGRVPLAELEGLRAGGGQTYPGGLDPDQGQGVASTHWHQGAGAVEVAVDEETGVVELRQVHAVVYAGRVVSRPQAELQNEGSVIMGIGSALFEAIDFDEGQITNANLSDYQLPAFLDVPAFTHELLERDDAEVHGLGETALPLIPAATGNALASLGLPIAQMPIHAEAVCAALDAREGVTAPDADLR